MRFLKWILHLHTCMLILFFIINFICGYAMIFCKIIILLHKYRAIEKNICQIPRNSDTLIQGGAPWSS